MRCIEALKSAGAYCQDQVDAFRARPTREKVKVARCALIAIVAVGVYYSSVRDLSSLEYEMAIYSGLGEPPYRRDLTIKGEAFLMGAEPRCKVLRQRCGHAIGVIAGLCIVHFPFRSS